MYPRLALDIGWRDLASVLRPPRPGIEAVVARAAPAEVRAVPALSVRTAFDALLSELALPSGSEVAMSAVNIEGMATIVAAHGLTLRAIDLDLATLLPSPAAVAAAIGPRTGLVVIAHLYGGRAPLDGIGAVCRAHGLPLVEDCAQAFAGDLTLSDGADVALYSFGPIKSATALGGAVALVRDPVLAARLAARLAAHPPLGEGWFLRRAAKYAVLKALNGPTPFGFLERGVRLCGADPDRLIGGLARGFSGPDLMRRIRRRPPRRLLALLARRLRSARPPLERQDRAAALLETFGDAVPGRRTPAQSWWVAPLMSRDPDALVRALRRRGFDASRGATSLRAFPGAPAAARLIATVVYLPVTAYLSPQAAARLCALVREAEGPSSSLELAA